MPPTLGGCRAFFPLLSWLNDRCDKCFAGCSSHPYRLRPSAPCDRRQLPRSHGLPAHMAGTVQRLALGPKRATCPKRCRSLARGGCLASCQQSYWPLGAWRNGWCRHGPAHRSRERCMVWGRLLALKRAINVLVTVARDGAGVCFGLIDAPSSRATGQTLQPLWLSTTHA
jgi:hypothetical protein